MSSIQELVELLDSILAQVPSDFNLQAQPSKRLRVSRSTTEPSSSSPLFDKVRTLQLLILTILPAFNNKNIPKDPTVLCKVFKTIQYLIVQDREVLIGQSSPLRHEITLAKLLPFLDILRYDQEVVLQAQLTIIEIAELICNDFQTSLQVQQSYISQLEQIVQKLFTHLNIADLNKLSMAIKFIQILQDHRLSTLLSLSDHSFQIDTLVRKLWLVTNHHQQHHQSQITAQDQLTSDLLLANFSFYSKDDTPIIFKLNFLLAKLKDFCNNNLIHQYPMLQSSMAKIVLSLIWETGITQENHILLKKILQLESSLIVEMYLRPSAPSQENRLNQDFVKAICIALYAFQRLDQQLQQEQQEENQNRDHEDIELDIDMGNTSAMVAELDQLQKTILAHSISPFADPDLENLRLQIWNHIQFENQQDLGQVLTICTPDATQLITPVTEIYTSEDHINFMKFLNGVQQQLSAEDTTILQKIYIYNSIGTIACIRGKDFDPMTKLCSKCDMQLNDSSYINTLVDPSRFLIQNDKVVSHALNILLSSIASKDNCNNSVLMVAALLSLKKIFASFVPAQIIEQDRVLSFLHTALLHDTREIRLLAAKILPFFLISDDDDYCESNFQHLISLLQKFRINQSLHLAESTIIAWSELAIVIGINEKLILVLVKLIDFLGSENQFQSTIAFHQLQIISSCKKKTPWQLLSPFLPHLSVIIVRQMKSKPMIIQKICGLVGVPIDVFLARTQQYTLPHLLTYYKHDLVGEISQYLKLSKYELIKRNLPKIIAHLLTVEPKINEAKIMQILGNVNDSFKNQGLHDLIENHILTSWEILKLYSPEFENLDRIKMALYFVSSIYSPSSASSPGATGATAATMDAPGNNDRVLKDFLNRTILGIVQNFSESTYDLKGLQPFIEKLKSIWAIDALILICNKDIVAALPQITACLQANLEIKHLHLETLYCLSKLTENLDNSTMFVILDFILSLILQKWNQFTAKCKKICTTLINFVMKNFGAIFKQRYYHYFFSFSFNPELINIYNDARMLFPASTKSSSYNLLHDLTIRCQHDNKFVVLQALDDLIHYFIKYQDEFHSNFIKLPTFIKYLPKLNSTLLKISYKFKNLDPEVLHKCSIIYGLIGSVDFNKFYSSSTSLSSSSSKDDNTNGSVMANDQLIIVNLFADQNEVYRFVIQFIGETLVPAFWASIDPVKQLFLAYAIQEYLKMLGLNGADVNNLSSKSTAYIIWNKFNRLSQSTLLPLLNSKYTVNGSKDDSAVYPIYKTQLKHSVWLREFTLDLLKKSKHSIGINQKSEKIFHICSSIIKDQDLAICNHILPYVALNCVLCDESIRVEIGTEILHVLQTDVESLRDNSRIETLKSCYQSIFNVLDYFQKWTSLRKQKRKRQDSGAKINEMITLMESFMKDFPQELIARRSAQCRSYERAILNMEESYRANTIEKQEFFSAVQSMYVEIDDLDSLDGVLKIFSTQSLNDKILQFQYSDDWKTAQDCYEALSEFDLENKSLDNTTSLLKSLNKFNLYENCLEKLDHIITVKFEDEPLPLEWINLGLNSSIFTGDLESIKQWVYSFESNVQVSTLNDLRILVNYEIAKSLIALHSGKSQVATTHIDTAIKLAGNSLAASNQISASTTRDIVNQLHWLTDAKQVISNDASHSKFQSTVKTMDTRLTNSSKNFQSSWKILTMRRVLDKLHPKAFTKEDISTVWIKLAQTAREHSRLDLSRKAIMNALVLQEANKEVDLEYAQLLWAQDEHSRALKAIDELRLKEHDGVTLNREAAKIQLIYTEWLDASDSGSSEQIIDEYTMAAKLDTKWEKPYYCLGKYYNKILENQSMLNTDIKSEKDYYGDYEKGLVFNYLRAVKTGHTYVFEALPKVITIWLDFSATYSEVPTGFKSTDIAPKRRKNYELMKQCIKDVIASTPKVYWYTVFSQLTSRMIHPKSDIQDIIVDLIAKITSEYPQQALWSVFAQSKSSMKQRAQLGSQILKLVSNYGETKSTLMQALALFDSLLNVCMQEVNKKVSEMNLNDDFGFNHQVTPCEALVVPLRENFEIKFPSNFESYTKKFSNFAIGSKITFAKIDDRVRILSSMQKPRRLTIRGSDGGIYNILCKPHDDLRKDAKLMEVTTMIDKLLGKDEESELRKLSISTYAVLPLNETYGIIEWVDRCRTMRDIILTYMASTGNSIDFNFCKKQLADNKTVEEKIQGFNKIREKYPPIFRLWFLEEFPDPKAWYIARNNFTRSSAVMSIVGHILGLGDRHMDNILMMEKNGGVLHVDFDCLFDKGQTLAVPERVPFRLTSNMVDAFGISGIEGVFRKSGEVTTKLIRSNETALMNILESFLYDPILDWSASKRRKKDGSYNPEVVLNNIKKKIRGIEKDTSLALSVPANVDALIAQATSAENLAQMYIGWMSFL